MEFVFFTYWVTISGKRQQRCHFSFSSHEAIPFSSITFKRRQTSLTNWASHIKTMQNKQRWMKITTDQSVLGWTVPLKASCLSRPTSASFCRRLQSAGAHSNAYLPVTCELTGCLQTSVTSTVKTSSSASILWPLVHLLFSSLALSLSLSNNAICLIVCLVFKLQFSMNPGQQTIHE